MNLLYLLIFLFFLFAVGAARGSSGALFFVHENVSANNIQPELLDNHRYLEVRNFAASPQSQFFQVFELSYQNLQRIIVDHPEPRHIQRFNAAWFAKIKLNSKLNK